MKLLKTLRWVDEQIDTVPSFILWPSIAIVLTYLLYRVFVYDPRRKHLPPGPSRWPIIGNTLQIDFFGHPQPQLINWAKKYGDLFYLRIGATDFIFVNTPQTVEDLFDQRGAIYADKPYLPMAGETLARGFNLALMGYNDRWKVSHHAINANSDTSTIDPKRPHLETGRDIPTNPRIRIKTTRSRLAQLPRKVLRTYPSLRRLLNHASRLLSSISDIRFKRSHGDLRM